MFFFVIYFTLLLYIHSMETERKRDIWLIVTHEIDLTN